MKEKEFLDKVAELKVTVYQLNQERTWSIPRYSPRKPTKKKPITLDDFLYVSWCSGGISGGSCWSEDNYYPMEGQPPEELYELDKILEAICPTMTFLQYKNLSRIVKIDSFTESEYYGNSTIYTYKVVSLRDLYNGLTERKLI